MFLSSLETETRQKDWNHIRQNKLWILQELVYTNPVTLLCRDWWTEAFWDKKIDWFWWGRILLLWIVLFKGTQLLGQVHVSTQARTQEKRGERFQQPKWSFGTILCSCVAKADDVPVWTSSSDGHRLSLFFPRKVADKRQGIQVADRVTCKCLSWAIYLSAFLAKRGDVCHSCQLCVIFPPCLSSSFIPWMEVLFYFLFLAQLAGAPLSHCLNGSCECANPASSRNG